MRRVYTSTESEYPHLLMMTCHDRSLFSAQEKKEDLAALSVRICTHRVNCSFRIWSNFFGSGFENLDLDADPDPT